MMMTENKRFEIDSKMYGATDVRYWLKDNANELVDGYGDEIYWGDGSSNGLKQIVNKLNELYEENKKLKEINQDNQDYISSLEEEKNNLQIKLQKIRDYAMEDGEVKQGVIEKVILND